MCVWPESESERRSGFGQDWGQTTEKQKEVCWTLWLWGSGDVVLKR